MKTTQFVLQTRDGKVQATFRFSTYAYDPAAGRREAYIAALRAQDAWERNAPQYLPEDQQQLTIVEK